MTQPRTSPIQRLATSPVYLTPCCLELLDQLGILDADGDEGARPSPPSAFSMPRIAILADGDFLDLCRRGRAVLNSL